MAIVPFRDQLYAISPRWLRGQLASRILYAFGVHFDLLGDAAVAAVRRRFPIAGESDDALWRMSRDRGILQGPDEPPSALASRLQQWWDAAKTAGNPYGLLEQLVAYWRHAETLRPVAFELIYASGTTITLETRGQIIWKPREPGEWAHYWIVFWYEDGAHFGNDGVWSDPGAWDDAKCWDVDLAIDEVNRIRSVPRAWNAAHARSTILLIEDGAELWNYPPGTWEDPGVWNGGDIAFLQGA